jgi:hypothetical protein
MSLSFKEKEGLRATYPITLSTNQACLKATPIGVAFLQKI